MNPSAGGLLTDWISLGAYWWLVLGCIALTVLVCFIVNLIRVWQETGAEMDDAIQHVNDDHIQQQLVRYHCAGNGHHLEADAHGWYCTHCGYVVRSIFNCAGRHHYEARGQSLTCTVCGFRSALPYDQEASA